MLVPKVIPSTVVAKAAPAFFIVASHPIEVIHNIISM
jgi:hypothetical protein